MTEIQNPKQLVFDLISDLVISFTIGPYYLDKNAAPAIDQDAGYWMLVGGQRESRFIGDTGLTRYSVDIINRRIARRGASAGAARAIPFAGIQ